ncbi:ABC transporter ATP-binding protein [Bradyrhizobium sp. ISRA443]|uniref:ABC transporter ATP-binding protein n=1 Tax=unclassified Bradyrhizobium TaxID=2631580 RepID=UPI00247A460C|nr:MULTISPECIES: ABC transporter ATP-binding protein [unclassified Bradyrhizobium]WGR92999.1 ABC transporter ATP-binding protein [Bradyrhizobium sp. ISRA435]WGR97491.1 ABC transporter ATP-binding protein [Bradyrhizobium sp. ISRA436]WGS04381.1 ABC transporter ATP-binding protein [Bradyrhizobium sp. ISRA437]WGS11263.1 ABC transporter ATP-binding protein [Bradyrhizobium sp. ISRA443]
MLRVDLRSAGYGAAGVVRNVRIELHQGGVLAVLGRNGVGKTTLMRAIVGLLPQITGSVELLGEAISNLRTHQIARRGVGYIPQGRWIFPKLTVLENLQVGTRAAGPTNCDIPEQVFSYFPILRKRLLQHGGTMSGGEQQMLAIARALCGRPKVLLMDEPTDGVQPNIVQMLAELIPVIARDNGMSILLVEQNLEMALAVAGKCLVMEKGTIMHESDPRDMQDPKLLKRFLAV